MNNEKKIVKNSVRNAINKMTANEGSRPQFEILKDNWGNNYLNVRNAVLIWTNFSGFSFDDRNKNNLDQFGKDKRYFNLVLDDETADSLSDLGWNVKEAVTSYEDYPILKYVKVNVRIQHPYTFEKEAAFPSCIHLVTNFNGKEVDEELVDDNVSKLDCRHTSNDSPILNIKTINCQIRSYRYSMNGNTGIGAALSTMTAYASEISTFADPHDAELASKAIKVTSEEK